MGHRARETKCGAHGWLSLMGLGAWHKRGANGEATFCDFFAPGKPVILAQNLWKLSL